MQKLLIIIIFTFSFNALSICSYQDLLNFNLDEVEGMTPKNCVDPDRLRQTRNVKTEEGICKCAKSNLDNLQYSPEKMDKKKLVMKSIEKAKIGLLSLSEEIFLLNNNKDLNNLELGPSCNSRKKLNEITKCGNKEGVILAQDVRDDLTKDLYNQLVTDSKYKGPRQYPKGSYPPALINRKKLNSVNQCLTKTPVSQKLIADIQERMLISQMADLTAIAGDLSKLSDDTTNIDSLIQNLKVSLTDNKLRDRLNKISESFKSNPLMNHIGKSNSFFKNITGNKGSLGTLVSTYTKNASNRDQIKAGIEKKCDAVFEAFKKSVCATTDDSFIPSKTPRETKGFLAKRFDTSKLADRMQVSSILIQNYCGKNKVDTNFESVTDLINPILSDRLQEEDEFPQASKIIYRETTLEMGKLLCEHLPPELSKLTNNKVYIDEGCADKDIKIELKSHKCSIFDAARSVLASTYDTKVEEVRSLALIKARELGITDEIEIAKFVEKSEKNINTNDIIEAHSYYNTPDGGNGRIVSSFLGAEPKSQVAKATTSSNKRSKNTSSKATNQVSNTIDLNGEDTLATQQGQQQSAMTYPEKAQVRSKSNLDEFYNNVTDRITRHKKNKKLASTSNKKFETPSETFNRVFESPYPASAPPQDSDNDESSFEDEAATVAYGMESDQGLAPFKQSLSDYTASQGREDSESEKNKKSYDKALIAKNNALSTQPGRSPASIGGTETPPITVKLESGEKSTVELPEDAIEAVELLLNGNDANSKEIIKKLKTLLTAKDKFIIQPRGQIFSYEITGKNKIIKINGKYKTIKAFEISKTLGDSTGSKHFAEKVNMFLAKGNIDTILAHDLTTPIVTDESSYSKFRNGI
jgi:hypothetical protein